MQIKVASLNFSGINVSPFEYYDGTDEKTHLNNCFRTLIQKYFQGNLTDSNQLAKIDKCFQKKRYSLLYRSDVGVARGKLLNREQFEVVWDLNYETKYQPHKKLLQQQNTGYFGTLDSLKMFDRLIYEAFLENVYGKVDWNLIKSYDSSLYLKQLKKWHSKKYLQLNQKIVLLNNYILKRNLDILFIQQAQIQQISTSLPDQYRSVTNQKSMIVFKKNIFKLDSNLVDFSSKFGNKLNFNNDSCYIKFKDYLLVSVHLSSKKIRLQQAHNMKETFTEIIREYPKLKVIVGIDANQLIKNMNEMNIFPLTEHHFTTRKRRTDMQLQFQKSGIIVQDVKDHLITNLQFIQPIVQTVKCEHVGNQLLPNQRHPFDHFAVYSNLLDQPVRPSRKNTISIDMIELVPTSARKKAITNSTVDSTIEDNKNTIPGEIPQLVFGVNQKHPLEFEYANEYKGQQNTPRRLVHPESGLFQFKTSRINTHRIRQKRDYSISKKLLHNISLNVDLIRRKEMKYDFFRRDMKSNRTFQFNKGLLSHRDRLENIN